MKLHHVYLVPGMFGFGRLAGFDYFQHVRQAIEQRFAAAGVPCTTDVVPSPPTSSLRHRARILSRAVESAADDDGPIHLIGHSTGGLDLRLVLSPSRNLDISPDRLRWTQRVDCAVMLNTPHYGTPLASHFATVSGTRLLYALSLLTVVSLSVGEPGLAIFSRLLSGFGAVERLVSGDMKLLGPATDLILRFIDQQGREEVQDFLGKIRVDQGGVIQIMPEAMDLFNASTVDAEHVRYGSVLAAAPVPRSLNLARRIRSPYSAFSAALFSMLYQFTAQRPAMYPYARLNSAQNDFLSTRQFSDPLSDRTSDGVVPTLSMIWGQLLWYGEADHLDVIGHFRDDTPHARHTDWLTSGAAFTRKRFDELMDAIVHFLLAR